MKDGEFADGLPEVYPERLAALAWRWYAIPEQVSEDLIQSAYSTFIEVRSRYREPSEHPRILVGIFRNKCRAHIAASVREARKRARLKQAMERGATRTVRSSTTATEEGGVLEKLQSEEAVRLILRSIADARPPAREVFRLLIRDSATREDLIRHLRVNKNTLDSRLHRYRGELKETLTRCGVLA